MGAKKRLTGRGRLLGDEWDVLRRVHAGQGIEPRRDWMAVAFLQRAGLLQVSRDEGSGLLVVRGLTEMGRKLVDDARAIACSMSVKGGAS